LFVGCEWLQVNKARAHVKDPAKFDEMYDFCSFVVSEYLYTVTWKKFDASRE